MDVLVTGAHGTVGTAIREQLGSDDRFELAATDVEDRPDAATHVADMRDYDAFRSAFAGRDAVVHLALDPALNWTVTEVGWTPALLDNLWGTVNAFRAAIDAGVEKLLFASTIHVVAQYEREEAPEIWTPGHDRTVDHTESRPDSMYAVAKCFGEALARFCADYHGLRCYCLRFGGILPQGYDHPYGAAELAVEAGRMERGSDEYERRVARTKAHWCSHRDLGNLIGKCLLDESVDFDVFYGVSDNARNWVDVDHARAVIDYDPRDDSEDWDAPPGA